MKYLNSELIDCSDDFTGLGCMVFSRLSIELLLTAFKLNTQFSFAAIENVKGYTSVLTSVITRVLARVLASVLTSLLHLLTVKQLTDHQV